MSDDKQDDYRRCDYCGCNTNRKRRACCQAGADVDKLQSELAAANEAREKAERERDEARENARVRSGEALDYYSAMLNFAHEFGAKDGDNMIEVIGNGIDALRAEVERLRALMARILEEPSNTMSDGKALREIIRMVKAQTAIDAARKPEPRMWYSKKDDPTSWNTDPDSGEAG